MGLGRAQGLNRLRIRYKTLGQASTLLPIDIDSLQQLDKMHGQSMDKISLTLHIWHHMWSCPTSLILWAHSLHNVQHFSSNWGEPEQAPHKRYNCVLNIVYIIMVRPSQTVCSNLVQTLQNFPCASAANCHHKTLSALSHLSRLRKLDRTSCREGKTQTDQPMSCECHRRLINGERPQKTCYAD